jgi:hypothetical protein
MTMQTKMQIAAITTASSDHPLGSPVVNFIRHYVEMVVAMLLGMVVLGLPLTALLELMGIDVSRWATTAPALLLLGMAFTMTVPMVAWMRYRGHGWAPAADMTASMFLPSLAAVGLLAAGLVTDTHALMMIQHIAMGPAMLVAMLLRRHEYTGR